MVRDMTDLPIGKTQKLNCVLADDHDQLLAATESLLRDEGIHVMGTGGTGLGALRLLDEQPTTVVVLDLRLPDLDGLEVARRVTEIARKKTAVVIYTSHADERMVAEALDAGVRAVVLKDGSPGNLLTALESVAADEIYVDPQLRHSGSEESS